MTANSEITNNLVIQDNNTKKPDFKILKNHLEMKKPDKIKNKVKFLCKKISYIKVENKEKITHKHIYENEISNKGRWTKEEHEKFLRGIAMYGTKWKKIKYLIKTRKLNQIRSHAQKFCLRMKSCKDETLGIDFTLDSIKSIKDMIDQIKSINNKCDIFSVFKNLDFNNTFIKHQKKHTISQKCYDNNKENINNKLLINEENKKIDNNYVNNLIINQNEQIKEYENILQNISLNQHLINCFNSINYNNNYPIINNLLLNNNINNNNNIFINQYNNININDLISNINNNISTNYFNNINNINNINNLFPVNNNMKFNNLIFSYGNNISLLNNLLIPLREQDINSNQYYNFLLNE